MQGAWPCTASTPSRPGEQLERCAIELGNLVVLDLRRKKTIWATNRFMIYALFPQANISIHVMGACKKQNTVLATGRSILNRSSKTHVGNLMLEFMVAATPLRHPPGGQREGRRRPQDCWSGARRWLRRLCSRQIINVVWCGPCYSTVCSFPPYPIEGKTIRRATYGGLLSPS